MALFLAAIVAVAVLAAMLYQQAGVWRDRQRLPPPGHVVEVGGLRLHLLVRGEGTPPVVLVSGIAASCLNWTALSRELATHSTVAAYDRPGLGWSELGTRGFTAAQHAALLRRVLDAAGIAVPVVLVAHSFGAFVAQIFADEYPDDVVGLVLLDPVCWQDWIAPVADRRFMLRGGIVVARVGAVLAALGVVRAAVARYRRGSERMGRALLGSFGGRATQAVSRVMGEVGKMPPETWDAIQAHWSRPRAFLAMARHFAALPASAREVQRAAGNRTRAWTMPLVVLGAATLTSAQRAAQEDAARQSSRGRYATVAGAGHWVHLDRPVVVRDAVLEVLEAARHAVASGAR